ncbi:MAG: putative heat-shock protein, partial [Verrucomicrobiaceae bacterium]|nr:putative heat-shock protein [Verrucomicrobiaceae bacterium]
MSNSPLAVLGLSPDAATVRDIKTAYARLLKVHRPDEDPEAFKRLRAAYEAAVAGNETMADTQQAQATRAGHHPAGPAGSSSSENKAVALTPGMEKALTRMRDAIASRARQRIRDSWEALDAESAHLDRTSRFHFAMTAFDDAQKTWLPDVCTDARLLAHVLDGEVLLPQLALKGWMEKQDGRRIREFVTSLNRARALHTLPECAIVMVSAAMALAPWEPETAHRLSQKAFPLLPPHLRSELMEKAEHAMSLGRLVAPLPEAEKMFWLSCL